MSKTRTRATGRGQQARGTATRPRLTVFRSNRYLSAQLIDDTAGRTLLGLREGARQAKTLGVGLAKAAKSRKITRVVFDRGRYRYAGRVKVLADAARAGGLIF